jgi:tetratricopeptide (TPR) repeat protein
VLISALILFLLWRIWHLSSLSHLVIDTFTNATGNDDLNKVLPGLNQQTREYLVKELEDVRTRINMHKDQDLDPLFPFPTPENTSDQQLTDLLKSLTDIPSGGWKTAVQLLHLVFTPRGTKVLTTLQSLGDTPTTLGISLQIMDLEGKQKPTLYTLWEPENVSDEDTDPQPVAESPPSKMTFPHQQAQSYYDIGTKLDKLGLFEDAINYFEEALKREKAFHKAALALSSSLSNLQVQKSTASAFTNGKQLQEAGQWLPALENYMKSLQSLSIADQAKAERAWKHVLKLSDGNDANAYLTLAELYQKKGVYLFDQALDLYKVAIAQGSDNETRKKAAGNLEEIQRTRAAELTKIATILTGLMQYDAAEKYLMAALAKVPEDQGAQALLANVKHSKPLEENKDALACCVLGQIYEKRGALDKAQSEYEDALRKQPVNDSAKNALMRVLERRKTFEKRYLDLMEPAARWLAIELSLREMEKKASSIGHRIRWSIIEAGEHSINVRAKLYNFIGYFHLVSASTYMEFSDFYYLAIDDFQQAIKLDENWFQPYENLSLTCVTFAQWLMEQKDPSLSNKSIDYLHQAFTNYDMAWQLFQKYKDMQYVPHEKRVEVERRILVGISTARLLSLDVHPAVEGIKEVWKRWKPDKETSSRLLYNLAGWYGIADHFADRLTNEEKVAIADTIPANEKFTVKDPKQAARRYVTYSIVLEQGLWDGATTDLSFTSIFDEEDWEQLKRKLYDLPKLSEMTVEKFRDQIIDVLSEMQKSHERSGN